METSAHPFSIFIVGREVEHLAPPYMTGGDSKRCSHFCIFLGLCGGKAVGRVGVNTGMYTFEVAEFWNVCHTHSP